MNRHLLYLSIFVLISTLQTPPQAWSSPPKSIQAVHQVYNTETPRNGQQVVHPHKLWSYGSDSDEWLFGFIITALIDGQDRVYLLDRWLGTVHVMGCDGMTVNQLSREGEGPGETVQPTDLTWLPGDELGITQPSPGRLVRIDLAGNPLGDIVPSGISAQAAQFGILTETAWRGGTLAYCGSQTNFHNGRLDIANFLAVCDLNTGADLVRILGKQSSDNGRQTLREGDQYWIKEGRWCLGPNGKIFTAPQRDTYAINIYDSDGSLEQIIERDYEPWHRTQDKKDALKKRWARPENEWGGGREVQISPDEPCISDLRVAENGELWVRHSRSSHDLAPGVFATWDVFAADGTYLRAVSFALTGNPDNDRLLFLEDDRLLLIRGYHEASDSMWGASDSVEQEIVREIVLYELVP